jgi:hypothetical protein
VAAWIGTSEQRALFAVALVAARAGDAMKAQALVYLGMANYRLAKMTTKKAQVLEASKFSQECAARPGSAGATGLAQRAGDEGRSGQDAVRAVPAPKFPAILSLQPTLGIESVSAIAEAETASDNDGHQAGANNILCACRVSSSD